MLPVIANDDVCEFITNELVCELSTRDAVAELLINPNAVICAELDTVPAGVLVPPSKNEAVVAKLELKTFIEAVCEFVTKEAVAELVTNPNAVI